MDTPTQEALKFGCVVSDPPWSFSNKGTRAAADNHYPTMSLSQVLRIPVDEWVAPDACLFLWVPSAMLADGLRVMDFWGFSQKQTLVWVKSTAEGKLQIGLGNYFRHAHELVLFGTRGRFKALVHNLPTVFWAPRGKHSAKPEALQDMAEKIAPGPYLEMFARRQRPGWHTWGGEVPAQPDPSLLVNALAEDREIHWDARHLPGDADRWTDFGEVRHD